MGKRLEFIRRIFRKPEPKTTEAQYQSALVKSGILIATKEKRKLSEEELLELRKIRQMLAEFNEIRAKRFIDMIDRALK